MMVLPPLVLAAAACVLFSLAANPKRALAAAPRCGRLESGWRSEVDCRWLVVGGKRTAMNSGQVWGHRLIVTRGAHAHTGQHTHTQRTLCILVLLLPLLVLLLSLGSAFSALLWLLLLVMLGWGGLTDTAAFLFMHQRGSIRPVRGSQLWFWLWLVAEERWEAPWSTCFLLLLLLAAMLEAPPKQTARACGRCGDISSVSISCFVAGSARSSNQRSNGGRVYGRRAHLDAGPPKEAAFCVRSLN